MVYANYDFYTNISIHAPREGSDNGRERYTGGINISIHAPREGSDLVFSFILYA